MYSSVDTHKHSQVSRSFKKLLKKIYGMQASLVHMSVKLKSSCTIKLYDRVGVGVDLHLMLVLVSVW